MYGVSLNSLEDRPRTPIESQIPLSTLIPLKYNGLGPEPYFTLDRTPTFRIRNCGLLLKFCVYCTKSTLQHDDIYIKKKKKKKKTHSRKLKCTPKPHIYISYEDIPVFLFFAYSLKQLNFFFHSHFNCINHDFLMRLFNKFRFRIRHEYCLCFPLDLDMLPISGTDIIR